MTNLQSKLEDVLKGVPGVFGVAVKHIQTGETANIDADKLFQMASVFKVPILATLLRDVEEGKISLDDRIEIKETDYVPGSGILAELSLGTSVTVKDLATLMIIVSDNIATDWLLKFVGAKNISTHMKQLGLNNIHVNQSCWELICSALGKDYPSYTPEAMADLRSSKYTSDSYDKNSIVFQANERGNTSTPQDMNRLLIMLANKEILTDSACDTMMDILSRQQFNGRIPYLLPEGTKVAHKTGTIHNVINDAGIVYLPKDKGAFAISVFSKGNRSMEEGEKAIARLAKAAYDHFS